MTSNQKHVNPKTVKRLLRISPRATSRTSPRTPPILRLDEDSLRKVFEKYSEMVDKPKIIADSLHDVFNSNPNNTISQDERKNARNILETTDIDTLNKIMLIVRTKKPINANVVYSLKEREILLLMLKHHNDTLEKLNDRLEKLNDRLENVKANFNINILNQRIKNTLDIKERVERVDTILKTIKDNLMDAKITEKNIKTLPDKTICEIQRIMEKKIQEEKNKIEKLLDKAMDLISLINKIINSNE